MRDTPQSTTFATTAIVAVIATAIGFCAVYAIVGPRDKPAVGQVAGAPATPAPPGAPASQANPLSTGEMLTFVFKTTPQALPTFNFEDAKAAPRTLADWKGKVVLLNLWATWCAPCRKEMPALDRLQKELGSDRFEVVALSVDRQGAAASAKFLEDTKVVNLKLYVESTSKSLGTLKVTGLPTTILIDAEGREVGRLTGPAEWDSAEAKRLIQSVLK